MRTTAVILAAGHGKRMLSKLPKVLHPLGGKPMIHYSIEIARAASDQTPVIVVGHGAEAVRAEVGDAAVFALQEEQLGTAHALLSARSLVEGRAELVLVITADMPLLKAETLQQLVEAQQSNPGPMTMLTVRLDDPHGFGRVLRRPGGSVQAIVEEAQASPEILAITELNASVYCFRSDWLWQALEKVKKSPKGEFYLTDLAEIAVQAGLRVQAITTDDPSEAIGINTRAYLAEAESILRKRINTRWMDAGVTLVDPASTYIEPDVTLAPDTIIYPNTYLRGRTSIGSDCQIGPNTVIVDTQVGNSCTIISSVLEEAILEEHVEVGPFAHLRPGAYLAAGVHMGNFGEVKDSYLGPGSKMGHFSYIGDATIGEDVNIGAGTITCNFDGVKKNKTIIGKGAFIGSDTMLVAPVSIGEGARTGAGAVVNRDVPENTLVVGVPARPLVKKPESE